MLVKNNTQFEGSKMKMRILCLFISMIVIPGAASAVEIYNKNGNKLNLTGKVSGVHYFSDNNGINGDKSYLRFGFKGETQISDQLTGYGQWQYQAAANNAESQGTVNDKTRIGFIGVKFGAASSFDYGRNYGVVYDIAAWTDELPEFGADTYGVDNFLFQRGNGLVTYRNDGFFGMVDGLKFAIQFQGKNGNNSESPNGRGVLGQNGDGWGLSTKYDFGFGFALGAAMFSSDRTNDQNSPDVLGQGDKATAYTGGVKYDANNIYLAAMFTKSFNATRFGNPFATAFGFANKAENWELVTEYKFDFGLRPFLAFVSSRGIGIENYGTQSLKKYVDVGTAYYFNKNMSTYVDYQINLIDNNLFTQDSGINTNNIVALGMVYQF